MLTLIFKVNGRAHCGSRWGLASGFGLGCTKEWKVSGSQCKVLAQIEKHECVCVYCCEEWEEERGGRRRWEKTWQRNDRGPNIDVQNQNTHAHTHTHKRMLLCEGLCRCSQRFTETVSWGASVFYPTQRHAGILVFCLFSSKDSKLVYLLPRRSLLKQNMSYFCFAASQLLRFYYLFIYFLFPLPEGVM